MRCGAAIPPPAPRTNPLDPQSTAKTNDQATKLVTPPSSIPTEDITKPQLAHRDFVSPPPSHAAPTIAAPSPSLPFNPPGSNPFPSPPATAYGQTTPYSNYGNNPSPPPYASPYSVPYSSSTSPPPATPGMMPGGYGANYPTPGMPPGPGYGNQPYGGYPMPQANQSANPRAIVGLILGIMSYVMCYFGFLFSIPGLILSKIELNAIQRGESSRAGETMAKIGFIASIVHLALFALAFVGFILISIVSH